MKFVLINPGTEMRHKQFNREPPQGLLYLAANLMKNKHQVSLLDLPREPLYIPEDTDVVGITCLTNTFNKAISLLKKVKQKLPDVKTVMGGPHVTFLPQEALDTGVVDYVVKGEGEDAILNLGHDKIIQSPPVDLSRLPLPARDLLDQDYDVAGIIVNRGCPFKCIYCVRQKLFTTCRLREPASIQQELRQIKDLGYSYFNLYDNINISASHAMDVCTAIHQSRAGLPWGCELRADRLDEKLATALSRSGCRAVGVGVESGSERVLKTINKDQDPALVLKGVEHAKRAGLIVQAYFVLGLPGETWDTFKQTLSYLKKLSLDPETDKVDFFMATPYPGSDLWEKRNELGLTVLERDWDLYDTEHIIFETKDLKREDIVEMRTLAREALVS